MATTPQLSIGSKPDTGRLTRTSAGPIPPPDTSLGGVIERFEALQQRPDSPVAAIRRRPARDARHADMPEAIDPRLREALRTRGIEKLYVHQAQSWNRIASGENVVVVTPTASGKTPVLQPAGSERARD